MKNLYLIGGGGHCQSCIDVIESSGQFNILGIFDKKENVGRSVLGYSIIGTDEDLKKYIKPENFFLVTVGQIKSPQARISIFNNLKSLGANLAVVISSRAYVSSYSKIEAGTIVMHDALVNANAKVGFNCILNSKSLIEHGAIIADHCHISTAAIVNGDCVVEEGSFIGSNAVLEEGVRVSANSRVSAGSFYRGAK